MDAQKGSTGRLLGDGQEDVIICVAYWRMYKRSLLRIYQSRLSVEVLGDCQPNRIEFYSLSRMPEPSLRLDDERTVYNYHYTRQQEVECHIRGGSTGLIKEK